MLTEKDYCDYETCVALKDFGITYFGLHFYKIGYPKTLHHNYMQYMTERTAGALGRVLAIPLYSAQKWLREEKRIGVFVSGFKNGYTFWVNNLLSGDTLYQGFFDNQTGEKYKFYEEALSEGIKEAVKILKEK